MRLAPDTIVHLKAGFAAAVLLGAVVAASKAFGPGWAVAAGSLALSWGLERYQAIRREGTPSDRDLIAGALPGIVLGIAVEVWRAAT